MNAVTALQKDENARHTSSRSNEPKIHLQMIVSDNHRSHHGIPVGAKNLGMLDRATAILNLVTANSVGNEGINRRAD
jgi:hypothetical protein